MDEGQIDSAPPIIGLQWLRLNRTRLRERWQIRQLEDWDDGM
jgi:hypothetical protein